MGRKMDDDDKHVEEARKGSLNNHASLMVVEFENCRSASPFPIMITRIASACRIFFIYFLMIVIFLFF